MVWIGAVCGALLAGGANAATFAPAPVQGSGLQVQAVEVLTPFAQDEGANRAAPKVVGGQLHYIDQATGQIIAQTGTGFQTVLDLGDAAQRPAGFTPDPRVAVLDMAEGQGSTVYVVTTSTALPTGAPVAAALPATGDYASALGPLSYQVIYRYARAPDGTLSNPVALASFEAGIDHSGGALLGLPDGDVLFATGDNLPFGLDGLAAPQDVTSHVGSILHIDGTTGTAEVVAKGVRNVQRMTWADAGRTTVAFSDLGGVVAEEVNTIPLADLLDTTEVENFGWGRNADGNAREGTFYIDTGAPFTSGAPAALGAAPLGELGFEQPYAEWGREEAASAAISGPVFSPISFDTITALFGDLGSGQLMATKTVPDAGAAEVFGVNVVDATGAATSLFDLGGTLRADIRFFNFPDMTAGVLLERAGTAYRLTQVASIPLPPAGLAMLAGLAWLGRRRFGRP